MPYNRQFTREEVHAILVASERRPRPYPSAHATRPPPSGHAISLHADGRTDLFSRPPPRGGRDSVFGSRKDLVLAVWEVLNSIPGQIELARLNHPDLTRVAIRGVILRDAGKLSITTWFTPRGGQSYVDWLSNSSCDGHIVQVFVLVYKLDPPTRDCGIHIQTAYAEDHADIVDDEIVRR